MTGAFSFVCLWLLLASHVWFASGKCRFVATCRREHVWNLLIVVLLWCLKLSCFYLCKVFLRSNVCEIHTWRWKRLCKFHIHRLYVKEFFGRASLFAKSQCQNGAWVRCVVHYPHTCWEHSGLSIATLRPKWFWGNPPHQKLPSNNLSGKEITTTPQRFNGWKLLFKKWL